MTNVLEADPSLNPDLMLPPAHKIMELEGAQLHIYDIPKPQDPETRIFADRIATDNPEGFSRLTAQGIDGLKDGESVLFGGVSMHDNINTVRRVTRQGENFTVEQIPYDQADRATITDMPEDAEAPAINLTTEQVNSLFDGLAANLNFLNHLKDISQGQPGPLAETIKALGYSDNNIEFPLPSTLKRNIEKLRAAGIDVPPIRVMEAGAIPTAEYNEAWEAGEFPVSGELGWFGHDATQDHWSALVVFGNEAMGLGQLFAQAGAAVDAITTYEYPDRHEINKPNPQTIPVEVTGEKKADIIARNLDQYTAELNDVISNIYLEPDSEDYTIPPAHMDRIREMVDTIMQSPEHVAQFVAHLESVGSRAMDDGKFSYETYLRELCSRTQAKWDIKPRPPKSEPQYIDADV